MSQVTIDIIELKNIIEESVGLAIRKERMLLMDSLFPLITDLEMSDIEENYGKNPKADNDFVDVTEWFKDENIIQ